MRDDAQFLGRLGEHRGILYKIANGYCRAPDDRGDLVQEMILQLWRAWPRYDERQRFSTWMYRVAMNVAISFYRHESRRQRDLVPLGELGFDVGDATVAASPDLRRLQEKVAALDELDRALVLLYLDEQSSAEIADIMGLTATNVTTRLSRIKKRLQTEWEK